MSAVEIRIRAAVSGPLFDGRAEQAITDFCHKWEDVVAQESIDRIRAHLPTVYDSDPWTSTGYYQSQIHAESQDGGKIVTDTPVIYGPWLEGVGSRNSPVTRFPGYHTFRLIGQQMDTEAEAIAERLLPPYIREMGG